MAVFLVQPLSGIISSASSVFPFLAGSFTYRKLTTPMRILFVLFIFAVATEIAGFFLGRQGIQNVWLFTVYIIVETGFVLWIISYWHYSITIRRLSFTGLIAYIVFVITNKAILGPGFLYMEAHVARSILLSLAILHTMFRLKDIGVSYTWDYRFWVLTAYFVYFSGTAVMYTAGLFTTIEVYGRMYAVAHSVLNTTANLVFAGAFLLCRRS